MMTSLVLSFPTQDSMFEDRSFISSFFLPFTPQRKGARTEAASSGCPMKQKANVKAGVMELETSYRRSDTLAIS